jgi:hypothetical protein
MHERTEVIPEKVPNTHLYQFDFIARESCMELQLEHVCVYLDYCFRNIGTFYGLTAFLTYVNEEFVFLHAIHAKLFQTFTIPILTN